MIYVSWVRNMDLLPKKRMVSPAYPTLSFCNATQCIDTIPYTGKIAVWFYVGCMEHLI